jgi:hypothetical protein
MPRKVRGVAYAVLLVVTGGVLWLVAPQNNGCPDDGTDCPWTTGLEPPLYALTGIAVVFVLCCLLELALRRRRT